MDDEKQMYKDMIENMVSKVDRLDALKYIFIIVEDIYGELYNEQ